jgi:hypothetical protein
MMEKGSKRCYVSTFRMEEEIFKMEEKNHEPRNMNIF